MHRYISYIRERRKILPVGWERWVTRWVGIENGKTSTCVNSRYLLLSFPCFSIGSRGKKIDLLREIDRAFYRWSRCCENVEIGRKSWRGWTLRQVARAMPLNSMKRSESRRGTTRDDAGGLAGPGSPVWTTNILSSNFCFARNQRVYMCRANTKRFASVC